MTNTPEIPQRTFNLQGPPELVRCKIGTVLAVRTGGLAGWWIRFGAAWRNLPNLDNHIVIVHHVDSSGTVWGIEGQPGGVGWVDCANYFYGVNGSYVVSNWRQPLSLQERSSVAKICESMLHVAYDWPAIAADALNDLRLPATWAVRDDKWGSQAPGHVVCSSLAAWAYWKSGIPGPYDKPASGISGGVLNELPLIQPGDWTNWAYQNRYS